jgi:hypothetical protein
MTTSKGLGISIKYGDHSRVMELRVNQHALSAQVVPQGDNLRLALLRKLPNYCPGVAVFMIQGQKGLYRCTGSRSSARG